MSENSSEPKFPQTGRGGWGYFPDKDTAILEGQHGARLEIKAAAPNGNTNPSDGIALITGPLPMTWKRAGSTNHPSSDSYVVNDAIYRQIGNPKVGYDTTIEFTIEIIDPSKLGSGPNGKGWYFYPSQEFLRPNFDKGSAQSTGTMQIWVNDGHKDIVGGCKWSRNVGSGIDGILLTINGGVQPVSESYPRTLPKGSKLRVKINYWVPQA
jgi:hypothetical protein